MKVIAKLSHEKLNGSVQNNPHLVVTLQAPEIEWVDKRPPLCVIALVDMSGSMQGTKIRGVQQSLQKLVDHVLPGDILGFIGFNAGVHTIAAPAYATSEHKATLTKAIHSLRPTGGTDLCSGMLEAIKQVEALDIPQTFLKRVIMFTDGQPTSGIVDPAAILRMLNEKRGGLSFSAFGYGEQGHSPFASCDHSFLTRFAKDGGGNYAYVEDEENTLVAFGRELGGLCSTYAQEIFVEVSPQQGHSIESAVTDIETTQDPLGLLSFKVPEILAEEERHFVFATKLDKSATGPRAVNVFNIKVTYNVLDSSGNRTTQTIENRVKAQFVAAGEEQQKVSPELDKVIALAQLVRTQIQAEAAARVGNYAQAGALFMSFNADLHARGQNDLLGLTDNLQQVYSSHNSWEGSQGYTNSVSAGITRSAGVVTMDSTATKQLQNIGATSNNSARKQYQAKFTSK